MSKTYRFAHLSDIHIGAFRYPYLQQLVLNAFKNALDICIERKVDFIVIAGDLFDSNLPDLKLVSKIVEKMYEVKKKGVEIYMVYGSHDFSPNQSSIVDILAKAGLFLKLTSGHVNEDKLDLDFKTDKSTGAKLVGMYGLKSGTEKQYYQILNRDLLEKEIGFKIFVFHGMINEYKPKQIASMDSMPISLLPKNFNYYAGGHLHERKTGKMKMYQNIVYPGTLFGADLRDIENSARGQKRGFYIVSFSDTVENIEFVEVPSCKFLLLDYNSQGKKSPEVQKELKEMVDDSDAKDKVVVLKVIGEMSLGKTSDVDFLNLRKLLQDKGAAFTLISYSQLTSREYSSLKVTEFDSNEIEKRIFKETISSFKGTYTNLSGNAGIRVATSLLQRLRQERKHNETKIDYESRISNDSIETMGLNDEMEVT